MPLLRKVPHQDPLYRGLTSMSKCPHFARDIDCNGDSIDVKYKPLAAQVRCFNGRLITAHTLSEVWYPNLVRHLEGPRCMQHTQLPFAKAYVASLSVLFNAVQL